MRDAVSRYRFRASITREGIIIVPPGVLADHRAGRTVLVTIESGTRGRTDAGEVFDETEVAAIAALQGEPAAMVRRCLSVQGAFAGRTRTRGGRKKPGRTPTT
jgi:hypothetical protein